MTKKKVITTGTALFFIGAFLVKIFTANIYAGEGVKIVEIKTKIAKLQLENLRLQGEIANSTSLTKIAEKTVNLELVKPENVVYLSPADNQFENLHAEKR